MCAGLMVRATSHAVCGNFAEAMRRHGVPQETLTDNGKVFTGRFGLKDTEALFDRICRENGIDHLLTAPRSPTTTGKIERFHRTLRSEFLTGRTFADLEAAQDELDRWVGSYNTQRPHQAIGMATPSSRFIATEADHSVLLGERGEDDGSLARSRRTASSRCHGNRSATASIAPAVASISHLQGPVLQIFDGEELIKTVLRANGKEAEPFRHASPGTSQGHFTVSYPGADHSTCTRFLEQDWI